MSLPLKVDVYWDEEGVGDDPSLVRLTRLLTARALAAASSEMLARVVNSMLQPSRPFIGRMIRTGISTYINNLERQVPVQIEVAFTVLSDPQRKLLHSADEVRLLLAAEVLNWFEDQEPETCERGRVSLIRLSLWLGYEVRSFELDPVNRVIVSGEGGEAGPHMYGYRVPHS